MTRSRARWASRTRGRLLPRNVARDRRGRRPGSTRNLRRRCHRRGLQRTQPSRVDRDRTVSELILEALTDVPVARRRAELVERKGLGHPDSVCDPLVETASLALNRMYLERAGAILHYNLDKALLAAGECRKGFGWGELTRPIEFIVGDRATFAVNGTTLPVEDVVRGAVDAWIAAHLPHVRAGRDLATRFVLATGSEELTRIFRETDQAIVSNDTSGASGWAPLSPTEELVLSVERFLNGAEFKGRFPDTGQDVQVFAQRRD